MDMATIQLQEDLIFTPKPAHAPQSRLWPCFCPEGWLARISPKFNRQCGIRDLISCASFPSPRPNTQHPQLKGGQGPVAYGSGFSLVGTSGRDVSCKATSAGDLAKIPAACMKGTGQDNETQRRI